MKKLILMLLCNFVLCCNEVPLINMAGDTIAQIAIPPEYKEEFDILSLLPDPNEQHPSSELLECIITQVPGLEKKLRTNQGDRFCEYTIHKYKTEDEIPYTVQDGPRRVTVMRRVQTAKYAATLSLDKVHIRFQPAGVQVVREANQIDILDIRPTARGARLHRNDIRIMRPLDPKAEYHLELFWYHSNIAQVLFKNLEPNLSKDILSEVGASCSSITVNICKTENDIFTEGIRLRLASNFIKLEKNPKLGQVIDIYFALLALLESGTFEKLDDIITKSDVIDQCVKEIGPVSLKVQKCAVDDRLTEDELNKILYIPL